MKLDRPVSRADVDRAARALAGHGGAQALERFAAAEPDLDRFLLAKAAELAADLAIRGVTDSAALAGARAAVQAAGLVAAEAVKRSREFRHRAGPQRLATG